MGLVFGQHDGVLGELSELPVQVGQHLLAVRVALGDQPRPPSAGDLADAAAQGPLADGRSASRCHSRPIVQPWAERAAAGCAGQAGGCPAGAPARSGPVAQPAGALGVVAVDPAAYRRRVAAQQAGDGGGRQAGARQQDHHQAQAVRWGPCNRHSRSQGQPAGQAGLASTLGGRILQAASSGRLCCGRLQRPARLPHEVADG